jgi:hypothetical protein
MVRSGLAALAGIQERGQVLGVDLLESLKCRALPNSRQDKTFASFFIDMDSALEVAYSFECDNNNEFLNIFEYIPPFLNAPGFIGCRRVIQSAAKDTRHFLALAS